MTTQRLGVHLRQWPANDQRLWNAAFEPGALFEEGGIAAHWADATRVQVAAGYGLWLGCLTQRGELDAALSPAARVTEARLAAFLEELRLRDVASESIASRLRDLSEALRIMEPGSDRSLVVRVLRCHESLARPSRDKRSKLVAPSQMYKAGIARMERAELMQSRGHILRALYFSDGLRIVMLIAKAVRLRNLVGTRIGLNLVKVGNIYRWKFAASETKTGEVIDAELPERLTAYIDRWLDHYRCVLLNGRATDALWISIKGTPMGRAAVYDRVCITTKEELGVRINPHAFRDIVATGVAIALPEDVRMIPFLLDHGTDRTGEEHYNLADGLSASNRYLERLDARRPKHSMPSPAGGSHARRNLCPLLNRQAVGNLNCRSNQALLRPC